MKIISLLPAQLFLLALLCYSVQPIATLSNDRNFTVCSKTDGQNLLQISWVESRLDLSNNTYSFDLLGKATAATISDLNTNHTFYSTAKTEVSVGVTKQYATLEMARFCEDVVDGCPINTNEWARLQKTVQLPKLKLPLGDIVAQYSAWTGDRESITCLIFAPIGYQNPLWADVFCYVPIAIGIFTIFTSILAAYATTTIDRDEITSNYIPIALQLKSPGVGDIIYYAQFIVTVGLPSLSYPEFYPQFLSNFAWSFLLLPSQWVTKHMFPTSINGSNNDLTTTAVVAEPDTMNNTNVVGTGLLRFTNTIHLDINGLFITVLVYFLLLVATFLFVIAVIWVISNCFSQSVKTVANNEYYNIMAASSFLKLPRPSWNTAIGYIVRCITVCYIPLTITSLYQLMLPANTGVLIAAATVVIVFSFLLYGWIGFVMIKLGDMATLLIHSATFTRIGFLYSMFSESQSKFFLYTVLLRLITSLMLGIFQRYGTVQLSVILVAEAIHFCLLLVKWPYVTKQLNILHAIIGWIRLTNLLLNIGFVHNVPTTEQSKHYIAYTQIGLHMLCFLLYFLFAFRNLCVILLGTKDDEFENSSMVPVRMTLWPRYRRNYRSGRHLHDYYRTPELDIDENQQLTHGGLARHDAVEEKYVRSNGSYGNNKNSCNPSNTLMISANAAEKSTSIHPYTQNNTSSLAPIHTIQRLPLLQQEGRRESNHYTTTIISPQRDLALPSIVYNSNSNFMIQQQSRIPPVSAMPQPISNTVHQQSKINQIHRTTGLLQPPPIPPPHVELPRKRRAPQQSVPHHPAIYDIFPNAIHHKKPDLVDNNLHTKYDDDINL